MPTRSRKPEILSFLVYLPLLWFRIRRNREQQISASEVLRLKRGSIMRFSDGLVWWFGRKWLSVRDSFAWTRVAGSWGTRSLQSMADGLAWRWSESRDSIALLLRLISLTIIDYSTWQVCVAWTLEMNLRSLILLMMCIPVSPDSPLPKGGITYEHPAASRRRMSTSFIASYRLVFFKLS